MGSFVERRTAKGGKKKPTPESSTFLLVFVFAIAAIWCLGAEFLLTALGNSGGGHFDVPLVPIFFFLLSAV